MIYQLISKLKCVNIIVTVILNLSFQACIESKCVAFTLRSHRKSHLHIKKNMYNSTLTVISDPVIPGYTRISEFDLV